MSVSVAWKLPRVVYREIGCPETLQLLSSGSDAPVYAKVYRSSPKETREKRKTCALQPASELDIEIELLTCCS